MHKNTHEKGRQDNSVESESLVKKYFQLLGKGDIDAVLQCLDDNIVWHVDGSVNVPTVGILHGKEKVRNWLEHFPTHFTPQQIVVDNIMASNEDVVVIGYFKHTAHLAVNNEEEIKEASPEPAFLQKRFFDGMFAIHFTLRKGKIARYHIFEDSLHLAQVFDHSKNYQERAIKINETVYAYTDTENATNKRIKPTVIFAHGLFVDRGIFEKQVQDMCSEYRCINVDMPAHGRSGFPHNGWNLEDIADDLALFIKESRLGQVIFVGQSQGGMIGIHLAAKYPELVNKLVLLGTSARAEYPERLKGWSKLRHTLLHGSEEECHQAFMEVQQRANDKKWLADNATQAEKERLVMVSHNRIGICLALDAAVTKRQDIRHLLPQITAPTLVVCGESDNATPLELSEEMAKNILHSTLLTVPATGHHLPLEAPDQVTAMIKNYVNKKA